MNEKGFAATGILYTILVMFIMFFTGMIMMLSGRNNILINLQKEVKDKIQNSVYDVVLKANDVEYVKDVVDGENVVFEVTDADKENATNIYCNNGAEPMLDGNNVVISNVISGTVCAVSPSLLITVNSLDQTKNNIVMLSDEKFTDNVIFNENTNAVLNLNSHQLNFVEKTLKTKGDLVVTGDNQNSKIISSLGALVNSGTGTLTINGGNYERTGNDGALVWNEGTGEIIIEGGNFTNLGSGGACVQNRRTNYEDGLGTVIINDGVFNSYGPTITNNSVSGTVTINGGIINSVSSTPVANYTPGVVNINGGTITASTGNGVYNQKEGTINITQTTKPIYITTLAQTLKPAVLNSSTGIINIKGNLANACISDSAKTTSGLCIYAEGNKDYNNDTANYAVSNNGNGRINVNGGTYHGGYAGISNHNAGTVNIKNAKVEVGKLGIVTFRDAITNICNSNISYFENDSASVQYDLWINPNVFSSTSTTVNAIINYSSNVIFTNGTNTPNRGGKPANMIPNYTGTCS